MKTSVVVPHFNEWSELPGCLAAVDAALGSGGEMFVVDNASEPSPVRAEVEARFPRLRWIQNPGDLGYGAAVNPGFAAAAGDLLAVVTPDVRVEPGALQAMAAAVGPETGILGGRLMNVDGTPQGSCGPAPNLFNWSARLALPKAGRRYYLRHPSSGRREVDWVTGAFLAVTRACWERIGGFDEKFFMYYEDADYCARARAAGFDVVYCGDALARHGNPHATGTRRPDWIEAEIRKSHLRYFKKHRPGWESALLAMANAAYLRAKGWET